LPVSFSVVTTAPERTRADLLAVPVFAGRRLGPGGETVAGALGGQLADFLAEAGFEGKAGESLAVPAAGVTAKAVVLVGVGPEADLTLDGVRRAAATVARRASKGAKVATTLLDLLPDADRAAVAQAIAEGVVLGAYQFLRYKQEPKPTKLEQVLLIGRSSSAVDKALERGATVARAVCFARDLVNEPAGALTPTDLAAQAKAIARGSALRVKVYDEVAITSERLGGLLGVAAGSSQPPRLIRLEYAPQGATGTVALVGKGITFDSGGLSLKTAEGMETMKTDMSGAAAVIATMSALSDLGVKTRVIAYVPTTENMPGGRAIKPGDVLKIRNGKTVEVLNTDAEGRLILADGLSMASEDQPDAIIDVATLTGACVVALGDKYAGVMGNDDGWVRTVCAAADRTGERMWPLPLPAEYRKLLDSEIADLKNVSQGRYGGALTAGLFLQEFVNGAQWAHVDIAGPARASSDDGYTPKGGTGFAVRTLIELVSTFEAPAKPKRATKSAKTAKPAKTVKKAAKASPSSRASK
jgi:leucyl aminopeptidase